MQPTIHYKITYEGLPFFFQHGLGANLAQAQGLLRGIPNIQLTTVDCPGHGDTPLRLVNTPSFDYYADEVIRLMNYLQIEKVIFGGISMGAGISINIALRYPQKVAGLVLVRPAWLNQGNPSNLQLLQLAAAFIGKKDGRAKFEANTDFQQIKCELGTAASSIMGVFGEMQQTAIPTVLENMVADAPFERMADLANITQPCLIIGNEDDPLHPFEMAEALHASIKGSILKKVTSRYVGNRLHKAEVHAEVIDFLRLKIKNNK